MKHNVSKIVAYEKATKVIESCTSHQHYFPTHRYIVLYRKMYIKEDRFLLNKLYNLLKIKFDSLLDKK